MQVCTPCEAVPLRETASSLSPPRFEWRRNRRAPLENISNSLARLYDRGTFIKSDKHLQWTDSIPLVNAHCTLYRHHRDVFRVLGNIMRSCNADDPAANRYLRINILLFRVISIAENGIPRKLNFPNNGFFDVHDDRSRKLTAWE